MNRKIKFRGKDIETDEWLYGNLIQRIGRYPGIMFDYECHGKIHYSEHPVKKETIGQFIGLKDCNGNDIYEGDIVERKEMKSDYYPAQPGICKECPETRRWVETHRYAITWNIVPRIGGFDLLCSQRVADELRIIGNVNDNPELLEE